MTSHHALHTTITNTTVYVTHWVYYITLYSVDD